MTNHSRDPPERRLGNPEGFPARPSSFPRPLRLGSIGAFHTPAYYPGCPVSTLVESDGFQPFRRVAVFPRTKQAARQTAAHAGWLTTLGK